MGFIVLIIVPYVIYQFISGGATLISHMVTNPNFSEMLILVGVIAVLIYLFAFK